MTVTATVEAVSVAQLIDSMKLVVAAVRAEDEAWLRRALAVVADEASLLSKRDPLLPGRSANRLRIATSRGDLPPR